MKTTVDEKEREEYPCLKIASDGDIVLFNNPECGMLIRKGHGEADKNLYFSKTWDETMFSRFIGSVTLEND